MPVAPRSRRCGFAFHVFTLENIPSFFVSFAVALVVGSVGPVYYTVWMRGRSLADLGLRGGDWRLTLALAPLFAGVQFAVTLARVQLPTYDVWLPLLASALVVGIFESIFFRGFIQGRLEASFGAAPAVAVAAGLYALYHIGYGMGADEILWLLGLGVVYAVAFRVANSVFVLWPLLTPLGSFYAQLTGGGIVMPMIAIVGFIDVAGVVLVALWLARRHERGMEQRSAIARPRVRST